MERRRLQDVERRVHCTMCSQKMRLIVSSYFADMPCGKTMVKLYRTFIAALADQAQARTHAFGTPDSPSNYHIDALNELVEKYSLIGKLTTTWNGTLSEVKRIGSC